MKPHPGRRAPRRARLSRRAILLVLVICMMAPAWSVLPAHARVASARAALSSATLFFAPSSAQPNATLNISGSGYPFNDTIAITLNSATLCSAASNGAGILSATSLCAVPTTLPLGSYQVIASDGTSTQLATTTLSVVPLLVVSGNSVVVGTQDQFSGYGFPANDSVNIFINGVFLCTVLSNSNGQFAPTNCFVSAGIPGGLSSYQVSASDSAHGLLTVTSFIPFFTNGTLSLNPTFGPAGTRVTAFATGFTPGEPVALNVSGAYITTTTADIFGDASVSFAYPNVGTTGLQTVTLSGLTSGRQASNSFNVTSTVSVGLGLTLFPVSGGAGTTVFASGYAYGQSQTIVINFGGTQVATTLTDSSGHYSTTFTVPGGLSGVVTVTAVESSYNYTASQTFSMISPKITVSPTTTVPGALLTVNGTGFIAGEAVTITLPGGSALIPSADANGNFATTLTVPAGLANGPATISAIGASSQLAVTAAIRIAAASLTASPMSVTAGNQVSVSGTGFSPGEYVLFTSPDGTTQTAAADSLGHVSVSVPIAATQAGGTAAIGARGLSSNAVTSVAIVVTAVAPAATATPVPTATPLPTETPTEVIPAIDTHGDTWYFASGRTDAGYSEQIDVLNPNNSPTQGTITFNYGSGQSKVYNFSLAALARGTYDVGSIIGAQGGIAAVVHTDQPVAATAIGAHGATNRTALSGVAAPAAKWYFAEGFTGQTFTETLDLFNPGDTAAAVQVTWPVVQGQTGHLSVNVAAHSRQSIAVNSYVKHASHSTIVSSDQPIVASRTFTFGVNGQGSAATQGTTSIGTTLYLAEGSTANGFEEYLSVLNPQSSGTANVTVALYGGAGRTIAARILAIGPLQRASIRVNDLTHASSVSAVIQSSLAVVVERTMYKGSPNSGAGGGTDALAITTPATAWAFASGDTGASPKEFAVLFNPSATATTVMATWYSSTGQLVRQSFSLPAEARKTIDVSLSVPALAGAHGLVLQSTNGAAFAAEQSLYDSAVQQGVAVVGAPAA